MKRVILLSVLLSFLLIYDLASKGTTSSLTLRFYPSAEAAAMGNTFSAIGATAESIYYNPASLSCLNTREVYANYTYWIFDMYDLSLAAVYPISKFRIALAFRYFYLGEITETLIDQTIKDKYTLYNLQTILSGALDVNIIKLGFSLKNLIQSYGKNYDRISSLAFDLALRLDIESFSGALVLSNIGGAVKIEDVENPIPFTLKLGAGYKILDNLKVGTDFDIIEGTLKLHLGTEYKFNKAINIRLGYEQIDEIDLLKGISVGFGYETEYSEITTFKESSIFIGVFNYSLTYLGSELGFSHRISLGSKF